MDFVINEEELAALSGLPHVQQLAYLRGIRPYMDLRCSTNSQMSIRQFSALRALEEK